MILAAKILLELLAGIVVIIEQIHSKERYRRILLIIAGIVMIGSAIYSYLDYNIERKSEIERKADLLTIQKMTSTLKDLAFELKLKEIDPVDVIPITISIESSVNTNIASSGLLADYIWFSYSPDSGWYNLHSNFQRYRDLEFQYDKYNNTLRFVLENFGLSAIHNNTNEIQQDQKYNRNGWEPRNIADLGNLRMRLSASALHDYDHLFKHKNEWCIIENIRIYANSFENDNLLLIAERNFEGKDSNQSAFYYYLPKWSEGFHDPERYFFMQPLHVRDAIINSL